MLQESKKTKVYSQLGTPIIFFNHADGNKNVFGLVKIWLMAITSNRWALRERADAITDYRVLKIFTLHDKNLGDLF